MDLGIVGLQFDGTFQLLDCLAMFLLVMVGLANRLANDGAVLVLFVEMGDVAIEVWRGEDREETPEILNLLEARERIVCSLPDLESAA